MAHGPVLSRAQGDTTASPCAPTPATPAIPTLEPVAREHFPIAI